MKSGIWSVHIIYPTMIWFKFMHIHFLSLNGGFGRTYILTSDDVLHINHCRQVNMNINVHRISILNHGSAKNIHSKFQIFIGTEKDDITYIRHQRLSIKSLVPYFHWILSSCVFCVAVLQGRQSEHKFRAFHILKDMEFINFIS